MYKFQGKNNKHQFISLCTLFFALFTNAIAYAQVDTLKVWYDVERKNLKEIYYSTANSSKLIFNKIDNSNKYQFFSLYSISNQYDRFIRFNRRGQIIAIAEVDSIGFNDTRARFSEISWLQDEKWERDSIQLNPVQEAWRFYGYANSRKSLIRERVIEYYQTETNKIKGVAGELEHLESSKDSIHGKNIDYIRNCDVIFTMFQPFFSAENESVYTPKISYQTYLVGGNNIGTTKEYFPYSGELAKEVKFKKGKIIEVICHTYLSTFSEMKEGAITEEDDFINYYKTVFKKKRATVYNLLGQKIRKYRKVLNEKVPTCQCDKPYFERASFYVQENEYEIPFLERISKKQLQLQMKSE